MGCVQSIASTEDSPKKPRVERLKFAYGYIKGEYAPKPDVVAAPDHLHKSSKDYFDKSSSKVSGGENKNASVSSGEGKKISREGEKNIDVRKIAVDEFVNGWPRWLVENVSEDALDGLVPKTADSYDKLAKVGQGTYSNVYKALEKSTGRIVALKKVRFDTSEPESIKFMAREIVMLKKLDHPNVIKLEGIATSRMQYSLYLVFEFMQSDLTKVITRPEGKLTEPQVKWYMQQFLSGLQHCHERGILHRDIKPSNLLIDKNGVLKIADFGLANFYRNRPKRPLTTRVVTLWYRAPELLLGCPDYGVGIDMWSAGCVLVEMFVGRPIMPGRNEIEQLHKIFKLCGSPSEDYWKKMNPPSTFQSSNQYKESLKETYPYLPESVFGLLGKLLSLDPSHRGTALSALYNEFFSTSPLPCVSVLSVMSSEERRDGISNMTQQRSQKSHDKHVRKVSFPGLLGDSSNNKEAKHMETISQNQETDDSSLSSVFSLAKSDISREIPPGTPTPAFISRQNRTSRTEAHPNALKNIKKYPLLMASLTETVHDLEESNAKLLRRSISNVDFRTTLDLDRFSKLCGRDE